jgi:3-oxoacyl-[acyl-carrier-protein] synthase II
MMPRTAHPAVTGIGIAISGLAEPADLLGAGGGRPAFDAATELTGRDLRNKDRGSRLAIRAVGAALADAARSGPAGPAETTAVVVSSNLGNLGSVCELADTIAAESALALNPLRLPETACSVIAASVAIRFGLRGPNVTICNGTASGLDAVFWAGTLLAAGRAAAVVVVGVEPTNDAVRRLLGGDSLDGAAALLLEPAEVAAERGAGDRLATVAGYGRALDPAAAITATGLTSSADAGLWLTEHPEPEPARGHVLSLEPRLGHCSGALGVLQCAVAAAYLSRGGAGPVLATASGADEPTSAVVLTSATGNERTA